MSLNHKPYRSHRQEKAKDSRPQSRGFRAGGLLAVASSTPATQLLSPAKMLKLNHAAAMGTAFAVRGLGLNCWVRGAFWEKCRPIVSEKRDTKLWQGLLTLPRRRPKDRSPTRTPAGNLRSGRWRSGKTGWGHPLCGTNISL